MARLVKRTPQERTRYVIEGKETWLCKCGLSKNQPYCDGTTTLASGTKYATISRASAHSDVALCEMQLKAASFISAS
jgi:CDGSH-type Zn-finger protein